MGKLLQRLKDASRSGVYRVRRDDEVLDALRGGGLAAIPVSLKGGASKAALMELLANALKLPDWFGGNWDALEDCLAEIQGYLLFYHHKDVAQADLGVLLDVLASSAEYWAERGEPFFAVFVDPDGSLEIDDLFREA
jgi:hypothetical protein